MERRFRKELDRKLLTQWGNRHWIEWFIGYNLIMAITEPKITCTYVVVIVHGYIVNTCFIKWVKIIIVYPIKTFISFYLLIQFYEEKYGYKNTYPEAE